MKRRGKLRSSSVKDGVLPIFSCAILFASACSTKQELIAEEALRPVSLQKVSIGTVSVPIAKPDKKIEFDGVRKTDEALPTISPRCLAFLAKAEQDRAVLAAPTLTASIDEAGDGRISLSYDAMNLYAMALTKRSAHARCDATYWLDEAKTLQKLSARSLTKDGALQRVRFIDKQVYRFGKMRERLDFLLQTGKVKENARNKVLKTLTGVLERANALRARAETQNTVELSKIRSFVDVQSALLQSVDEQVRVKQKRDLARNVRLTISGGYSLENEDDDVDSTSNETFGRASVSIKLGAFAPHWQQVRIDALGAEIDKLYEPGIGALWRITDTYEKNKVTASALSQKHAALLEKVKLARKKRQAIVSDKEVELMLAELEIIKLRSEILEVKTNLRVLARAQELLAP